MTNNAISLIISFSISSYATGWCLVGHRAVKKGIVDLCQFVRAFILGPFVAAGAMIGAVACGGILIQFVIPNILRILIALAIIAGVCLFMGFSGYFVVKPAVKKAYGIAKPFSEKICIVMYKR